MWSLEGFLLFSDTVTNKLHKFVPGKGDRTSPSRAGGPIGNAYDDQGRLYTCEFRAAARHAHGEERQGGSARGALRRQAPERAQRHRGAARRPRLLHRSGVRQSAGHARAGFLRRVSHHARRASWRPSRNGRRVPTASRSRPTAACCTSRIRTRAASARTIWTGNGAASNERVFVDKIHGVPGRLRTDEKGNLYVAAKYVYVYSPQGEAAAGDRNWRKRRPTWPSAMPISNRCSSPRGPSVYRVRARRERGVRQYAAGRYPKHPLLGVGALIFRGARSDLAGGARRASR